MKKAARELVVIAVDPPHFGRDLPWIYVRVDAQDEASAYAAGYEILGRGRDMVNDYVIPLAWREWGDD